MNPVKILELKGKDFMQGLSIQSGLALGGLFQSATNFDPFDTMGYLKASVLPTLLDETTITTEVKHLISVPSGTEGYVFALGDRIGATGTSKCFYRIKISDLTVTNYSTEIDANFITNPFTHRGMAFYKNRIIYDQDSTLRSNIITPAAASDTLILNNDYTGGTTPVMFDLAPDGYLYWTANCSGYTGIGRIVSVTDTTNNTATAFSFIDTTLIPKDITNDGYYTIFIADNNPSKSNLATTTCKIYFWNRLNQYTAQVIYDIPESYLISCRYVNGRVLILGSKGLWVCNSATPPKLIYPMESTMLPTSASVVTSCDNILKWGSSRDVYAYGSKIGNPIVYSPYITTDSDNLHTALICSGDYMVASIDAGTNTPKIYVHNYGTSAGNATVQTAITPLVQPYTLSEVKVTLKKPLSAGQSISIAVYNGNGAVIMNTSTKTYVTDGAKQTFTFKPNPTAGSVRQFEDVYVMVNPVAGAIVQRVTGYGIPTDDNSQNI